MREVAYYFMSLLYVLAVLLNWLACMMLAIAHHEDPQLSWLASVKVRGRGRTAVRGGEEGCQGDLDLSIDTGMTLLPRVKHHYYYQPTGSRPDHCTCSPPVCCVS
jgi:hypothetical protein